MLGEIKDSTFNSTKFTAFITITGGNEEQNDPFLITRCNFSGEVYTKGLINSYNSPISIESSNFTNSSGTHIKHIGPAEISLEKIISENTTCKQNSRGCLLESIGNIKVTLYELNVYNMTMPADCSVITLDYVQEVNFVNSIFDDISGSAGDACLSALNSNKVDIRNFTVKNFLSGCISIKDTQRFVMSGFLADNSANNKTITNEIVKSDRSGSVINVERLIGYCLLQKITIKGYRNLVTSQGGAMRLIDTHVPAVFIHDVLLQDNEAEIGGGIFTKNTTVSLWNVTFLQNKALRGGGLYLNSGKSHFINNSVFEGNAANLTGGGVHFEVTNNNSIMRNTIFLNNRVVKSESSLLAKTSRGGAIYYYCADFYLSSNFTNLDVRDNSAEFGGAIYFNNCIFDPTLDNKFTNNFASKSGSTFASYPPVQLLPAIEQMNSNTSSLIEFSMNGFSITRETIIKDFFIYDWNDSTLWHRFTDPSKNLSPN